MMTLAQVRKAAVAAAGIVGQVVAAGVIPDRYLPWTSILIAALTAVGVYGVPNAPIDQTKGPAR